MNEIRRRFLVQDEQDTDHKEWDSILNNERAMLPLYQQWKSQIDPLKIRWQKMLNTLRKWLLILPRNGFEK